MDEADASRARPAGDPAPVANRPVTEPPVAARRPVRHSLHGVEWTDEYAWLAERGSREALDYLEAENAYAEGQLRSLEPLRTALYEEFVGRIQETDSTVPVRLDDFYYYSRTEPGCQYAIHCRRRGSPDAPEQVLLDPNELSDGADYLHVGAVEVSPDHRLLAYCLDRTGGEAYRLMIEDLESGEIVDDRVERIAATVCWANDSRTLFYATLDASRRPYRVFRHRLGEPPTRDAEVYREDDEAFFVSLERTRSRRFLLIRSASSVTSEVRYVEADVPESAPCVIEPRRPGVEYWVGHRGDTFVLRTNAEAQNFRLVERPVGGDATTDRELLGHRPEVKLERVDVFADRTVVVERQAGLPRLRVLSTDGERDEIVPLPESVCTLREDANPEFETSRYRFRYGSLVTPTTVLSYDGASGEVETLKVQAVRGYAPERYRARRVEAVAPDGTAVPVSLVHRRDLELDGSHPCLLNGYGAYGATIEPVFSPVNVSLLDRGFVLATAHVRGGGLLGEAWHESGRMLAKRNSFTDFVAVAEHLIAAGYTCPGRLAARGGSAGGLLVGAAVNLRPDLFRLLIAQVPFVDVTHTMLDASIPLTVIEYEEWGNPRDPEYFDYMRSYSPYDNVTARDYPAMLVTAGLNDPRVQYWEPAKWVARLRARKTNDEVLLLRTHMGAGHGGPSGRYAALRERALEYAFLIETLAAPAP